MVVGEKIVTPVNSENKILIKNNVGYHKNWSIVVLVFPILLFLLIVSNNPSKFWSSLLFTIVICLPILGLSFYLFKKSQSKSYWYIDLSKKAFVFTKNSIPFNYIKALKQTSFELLHPNQRIRSTFSYQLNLVLKNDYEFQLFNSDVEKEIIDVTNFLNGYFKVQIIKDFPNEIHI